MPGLYDWYLAPYEDIVMAKGIVYGHPGSRLFDGRSIHTSRIREMAAEEGSLVLTTDSGSRYLLRPEEIEPNRMEATADCLAQFGIEGDFAERCAQARLEAEIRFQAEEGRFLEPGELLLTTIGASVIRALFRAADGTPVSMKPAIHAAMFQDSVLITDREVLFVMAGTLEDGALSRLLACPG